MKGGGHFSPDKPTMGRLVKVVPSKKARKKYDAVFDDGDVVSFGAKGYSDFTEHHDAKRKESYLARHSRQEDWQDPKKAGTLARFLLWNKPTLSESIKDFKRKFHGEQQEEQAQEEEQQEDHNVKRKKEDHE